ncbi:transcriptional regulator [Pantoea vagans]|uniref:helix-turn-helix transcriptional regulator n=1 Tax=Pantoea pleuroti TaxID=1592631 RepID=UPI0009F59026|nr:LuxR family transcriptional regulator [Pantoea vagans]MBB1228685.1 LuxR family transcriptional regulator [Pantoea pleuroti]OQV40003.1 transcriptional regulator [Pantoea vagans]
MKDTYYNDTRINLLIQNELNAFFEDYKGVIYAYAIMNKKDPSQMRIINNNPEWFDIYLERKYQFIDPVIIQSLRCIEDFFWENNVILSGGYNLTRIFNESFQYNIFQGQTFPLHDYLNNLALLSIISQKDAGIDMEKNRSKIVSFLINLHQKTLNLYSQHHQKKNVFLSPRERQILKWVGAGKTYAEVAVILSIAERTVKFHMGNVMKKLGVNNATHAVKLGTELRLLDN